MIRYRFVLLIAACAIGCKSAPTRMVSGAPQQQQRQAPRLSSNDPLVDSGSDIGKPPIAQLASRSGLRDISLADRLKEIDVDDLQKVVLIAVLIAIGLRILGRK